MYIPLDLSLSWPPFLILGYQFTYGYKISGFSYQKILEATELDKQTKNSS